MRYNIATNLFLSHSDADAEKPADYILSLSLTFNLLSLVLCVT